VTKKKKKSFLTSTKSPIYNIIKAQHLCHFALISISGLGRDAGQVLMTVSDDFLLFYSHFNHSPCLELRAWQKALPDVTLTLVPDSWSPSSCKIWDLEKAHILF
jgi:hypothetical protein